MSLILLHLSIFSVKPHLLRVADFSNRLKVIRTAPASLEDLVHKYERPWVAHPVQFGPFQRLGDTITPAAEFSPPDPPFKSPPKGRREGISHSGW